MHLLFLDEAGDPSGKEFVLGGVALGAPQLHGMRSRWRTVAAAAGWAPATEFKWSGTKGQGKVAHQLIDLLIDFDATAFAVEMYPQWGKKAARELFASPDATYATGLTFLAERFQYFLRQRDSFGVIVIDHREASQDDRLRAFFGQLAEDGTPFTALDRIIDPIFLSPSHHTLGVQAADLVVGSMFAICRSDAPDGFDDRRRLARELHERLWPLFARHPFTGEVEGVGIKHFPPFPDIANASALPPGKLFNLRITDDRPKR